MPANVIPEKVINYNVYDEGEKLVGLSAEVTLPKLESLTETISGAGILGEIESPTPGHFGSLSLELTFRQIFDRSFNLALPGGRLITLRASQQSFNMTSGVADYRPLKISMKVFPKGVDLGTIAVGKPTDTKNTLEILYIKIEENKKTLLELDKLNFIFIVNGVDVLAAVRDQI